MISRLVAGVSLAILAASCGGSPVLPTTSVDGRWVGTLQSTEGGPGTFDARLSQAGLQLTGSMQLTQDGISNVMVALTGLLDGPLPTTAHLTATYVYGLGCEGSFTADLNVSRDMIVGSFRGSNCVRPFSGQLQMTRPAS